MHPSLRRFHPRFAAGLVFAAAMCGGVDAQVVVYDDFSGPAGNPNLIAPTLWDADTCSGVTAPFSQSGGLLRVRTDPSQSSGRLGAVFHFRGDFDFELDYRNFSSTATTFTRDPTLSLEVWDSHVIGRDDFYFTIERRHTRNGHEFRSEQWDMDSMGWSRLLGRATAPATGSAATAGRLRLSRHGNSLTAQYLQGGNWTLLATYTNHLWSIVSFNVRVHTGDNGAFSVDSDYVTYKSGTMISDSPYRYGVACHGLRASSEYVPRIGSISFGIFTGCASGRAALYLILGVSGNPVSWGRLAPGCHLNASPNVILDGEFSDATGEGGYLLPIPNTPSLVGGRLFAQMVAHDPSLTAPLPLSFSEGVAFTILP